MIGFYGIGGGFGHLTRIRTFIDTYSFRMPYKVISTNDMAFGLFESHQVVYLNPSEVSSKVELRLKIKQILIAESFSKFYIDTFPNGILGELTNDLFDGLETHFLARRIVWKNYLNRENSPILFKKAFIFEPLESDQLMYLENHSDKLIEGRLEYRKGDVTKIEDKITMIDLPIWLIAHTSHKEEVKLLLDHAQDLSRFEKKKLQFVILSDVIIPIPEHTKLLHDEDPVNWYPIAERIFSAAGFNTMYELREYRHKHICLPFVRKFDDQFWRTNYLNKITT